MLTLSGGVIELCVGKNVGKSVDLSGTSLLRLFSITSVGNGVMGFGVGLGVVRSSFEEEDDRGRPGVGESVTTLPLSGTDGDGSSVGTGVGESDGSFVGAGVGEGDGTSVGAGVGESDGTSVGATVVVSVGIGLGVPT